MPNAKHKLANAEGGFPSSDVYQMLAYCTALGLESGTHVYAGSRVRDRGPETHVVSRTKVSVRTWALDVAVAPDNLVSQVRDIAGSTVSATSLKGTYYRRTSDLTDPSGNCRSAQRMVSSLMRSPTRVNR